MMSIEIMGGLETSEVEIPIGVGGITRWMQGLTKLTTCDDIVYSLLYSMANPSQGDPGAIVDNYGLFESYGDQERKLSGRTKILRVWYSWGSECNHVRYSLRKVRDDYDQTTLPSESDSGFGSTSSGSFNAPRRVCGRREMRNRRTNKQSLRTPLKEAEDLPPSLVHLPPESPPKTCSHVPDVQLEHTATMQKLMTLILAQENRVQDIHRRINEIDSQIENYESNLHHMRVKSEGPNYLQNAYLSGVEFDGGSRTKFGTDLTDVSSDELQTYVDTCQTLVEVDGKLESENTKIDDFSLRIQDETFLTSFIQSPLRGEQNLDLDSHLEQELDITRREVQSSRSLCSENVVHMDWIDASLNDCAAQLAEKNIILSMLQEHERGVCDTIEEVNESLDDTKELHQPTPESTSHIIIPEPLCSSTPNSARTSPVLHLQHTIFPTKPTTHKINNHPTYDVTSKQNQRNSVRPDCDPSLTVIAPDNSMGSMYGVLYTTEVGCKSPGSDTDTTSDTGLSSMHSTTSEDVVYTTLETLV